MAYQFNASIGASSVVGARAASLHQSSMKEQRKLEENLQSLSKEMRSRINQLDSETSEMRRHAVRMFDSVRRKEHQRMMQSRQEITSLRAAESSDSLSNFFPRPPSMPSRANSAGRLKMTQSPPCSSNKSDGTSSDVELSRCYSSPASIDKLSPAGAFDIESGAGPSSKGDFSDESIAADAASIPVTVLPNFCNGRELGMIGESAGDNCDNNYKDYDTVFEERRARHCVSEGAPSPPLEGRRHSQNLNVKSASHFGAADERGKLLTRRRRTSEIIRPVSVTTAPEVRPSRRHSSHEPAFLSNSGTRSSQELLLHRTSSVNLPLLGKSSVVLQRTSSNSLITPPPLSPHESTRNVYGARHHNSPLRRSSRTESSPCIMKQTFASTPRRSMSQVVGELVHIEEIRRHSRGTSIKDDVRRARGALQGNRSFPGCSAHFKNDVSSTSLSETQSLGNIFDELKDCRYLRITNQHDQDTT